METGRESSARRLAKMVLSVVVPPAGIVLWWLGPWARGRRGRVLGILGRSAVSAVLLLLTLIYLVKLDLVHVELGGEGWRPIFSARDPKADEEALEAHRAAQRAPLPPAPGARPGGGEPGAPGVPPSPRPAPAVVRADAEPDAGARPARWIDFRGLNRDGVYTEGAIFTTWPREGLERLWKQPVGGGYASFVVAGGRAFTIEQRRAQEAVAAYDVPTGRELWTHAWEARFSESMGGDGPRATPVWNDGRLYALGAAGELRCLEAESGRLVWRKDILADNDARNVTWGMSNAPLVAGDAVVVTPGGRGRSVVAYDKRTGARLWGALDDRAAYTSPMAVTLAGERQLLVVTASRMVGLAPESGTLLWEYPWVTMYDVNSAQPIVTDPAHVLVTAGYDHGAALVEVARRDGRFAARTVWENKNLKSRFNSPLLHRGFVYGFDEGIFACIDAATGERRWKGGRYSYGQALLAGDRIIVLTESGELVLVEATPEAHREIARFPAIEGKTWNHPALAGGILLVRNEREMAAFRAGPR